MAVRDEYTIDDLARRAQMTVRNVRSYQDRGLIPPPERRGRVGIYSDVHLLRLRVVGKLLGRGFNLANIADLLGALDRGDEVGDVMGLEEVLSRPWTTEVESYLTIDELAEAFGSLSPRVLARATELGYLSIEGSRVRVPSPRMLNAGRELVDAGLPLEAVLDHAEGLQEQVAEIAQGFAALVLEHVFDAYGDDALPPPEERPRLAEIVHRLRPLATTVVTVELARALETAVHEALGERLARSLEREEEE